jgi:starch synthase (maltosyl-transferring)
MTLDEVGPYAFSIVAWTDCFGSWRDQMQKNRVAGQEVSSELLEGMALIEQAARTAREPERQALLDWIAVLRTARDSEARAQIALAPELAERMERSDPRWDVQAYDIEVPVWVDRARARFGSWYEMFPRSCGSDLRRGSTFREAQKRLPDIAALGLARRALPAAHPSHRHDPPQGPQQHDMDTVQPSGA